MEAKLRDEVLGTELAIEVHHHSVGNRVKQLLDLNVALFILDQELIFFAPWRDRATKRSQGGDDLITWE